MKETLGELRQTKNTIYIGAALVIVGGVLAILAGMPVGVGILILGGMVILMSLHGMIYIIARELLDRYPDHATTERDE